MTLVDEYGEFSRPETLDFHIPYDPAIDDDLPEGPVVLNYDDDVTLHRQLLCWCLVQRFRYYVLSEPVATDGDYDAIEKYLIELEQTAAYLQGNKYSPSRMIGSCRRQDYPRSIRTWFPVESYPASPRK